MKYVEPEGYLGIMNCRQRMAYALAPIDNMPRAKKVEIFLNNFYICKLSNFEVLA